MAGVLDALASYVASMLAEMSKEEVSMLIGVSDGIEDLGIKLGDLKNFLADADRRNITDESVRRWVVELKRAMYQATDIVDLCRLKAMEQGPSKDMGCFNPLIFCMRNPLHAHDIGTRMKALNEKLDSICKRGRSFDFVKLEAYQDQKTTRSLATDRKTDSLLEQLGVVGEKIEEDTRALVEVLTREAGSDKTDRLMVVAIVGVGGIGKTTLGKKIFNDEAIKGKFTKHIWLSITQDFTDVELLSKSITAAGGDLPGGGAARDKDLLVRALMNTIMEKKLFLVLDDLWGIDAWNKHLIAPFSYGGRGSRVLITTRHETVARSMKAVHYHHIDKLGPEDAWSLLKRQACAALLLPPPRRPPPRAVVASGSERYRPSRTPPMSLSDGDEAAKALAAAKEVQDAADANKAKLALASAANGSGAGSSAGSFSLTSLHAQAVGLHSIKGHVPVELALDTGVHRQWRTFFRAACRKYALLAHLDANAPAPPTPEWSLLDATVVSWLYGSVSLSILDAVMTPGDDPLAVELWNNINGLFNDHKINRQLHLTAELGDVKMGEMSMTDYLQKVKSISDGLADLGSPVDDAEMVVHCLNGLSEQYESAADLISLMPGMSFAQCRSLLSLQDMKRKNRRVRNTDTAFLTNAGNPGKGPGKGKKKKKAATDAAKDAAPAPAPAPAAPPTVVAPSWPSPQHPWNGAIQMWPYGQGGMLGRQQPAYAPPPSYVPRHAPSPHAFYAQSPYGVAPAPYAYNYGYAPAPPNYGLGAPASPAPSTASWDQAALMNQFQTMGLQAPTRERVMDTGASSHFASDPGPSNQDRDSTLQ